ncbi:MAG TPA: hypothetical protein VN853_10180 [Polyangia bacterium]|jgi:hypothetical protein|nr:hypothetical protein [Polyangia bacterium]
MKANLVVGLCLALGGAPLLGCAAHGAAAPQVVVMLTGGVHPALPDGCPLTFINNQHLDILASGYEQLGLISFAGTTDQMTAASSKMPGAVAAAACKMGGTSVSLANALATQSTGLLQFSVWRAPAGAASQAGPAASSPPTQGI